MNEKASPQPVRLFKRTLHTYYTTWTRGYSNGSQGELSAKYISF